MFFIWLSENEFVSMDLLKELVINNSIQFHLSYEIERCLNKVFRASDQDLIFHYLISRFDYKKSIVIRDKTYLGYDFVPVGDHSHLFDGLQEQKSAIFVKALEWYLSLDGEDGSLFFAKDLLEYLQPSKEIDSESLKWYQKKLNLIKEDCKGLDRLIESLSVFENKDENLLDLVISGYSLAYDQFEENREFYVKIRNESYLALTKMGVKSGTAGEPFQADLDLQNLIQTKVNNLPEFLPVTQFLKEVLKSVEVDIANSSERNNLKW